MSEQRSIAPLIAVGVVVVVVLIVVVIVLTSETTPAPQKTVPGSCGQDGSPLVLNGELTDCSTNSKYQIFTPGSFTATAPGIYGDFQSNSASSSNDCALFAEQNNCVAWSFNKMSHDSPCRAWLNTPYAVTPDMNGWSSGVLIGAPAPDDGSAGRQGSGACSSQAAPFNLDTSSIDCEDTGEYLIYDGYPTASGKYLGDKQSSATSVKDCRKLCDATPGCTAFAISTDLTGTFPCRIFTEPIPAITSDFTNWKTYIYDSSIIE